MTHWVPELLAPAGSFEKAQVALSYGADAIYLAGQKFGLRTAADNFTPAELIEVTELAHQQKRLVYVVLNSFLHDRDLEELPEFLQFLEEIKVDALIVSDLGVIKTAQKYCQRPIHLSTQASCLNADAALFWRDQGVTRLVLGREASLKEAREIKKVSGLEIEMFIHGSLCMAYSGNCVISNYTQGRDSNRGGCAHSCRFDYGLDFSKDDGHKKTQGYFMSSKDLEGLSVLPEFIESGIDSLKVEGRMKSHHYAGTISKVYSEALNFFKVHGTASEVIRSNEYQQLLRELSFELSKVSHRQYTTASLVDKPGADSVYNQRDQDQKEFTVAGVVLEAREQDSFLLEVRSGFDLGSEMELVPFKGPSVKFAVEKIESVKGVTAVRSKPGQVIRLPWVSGVEKMNLVRFRQNEGLL